jgi:2-polyprenyl-3-methyl-5-hydroxy-6-metoxy-1,4-benzoquinol methylase
MQTVRQVALRANYLYSDLGGISALLQTLRPHICPFELILPLIPAGSRILDAGCGAGLFLGLLADAGIIAGGFGFDSNGKAIDLARRMTHRLPTNIEIEFQQIDARSAWPQETFDVVSLIDVLHHVPVKYQLTVLSQAIARVKPGGILVYKDMAQRPYIKAQANRLHDLILAREWIHYLPIAKVDEHLVSQGMKQIGAGSASRYWYAHEWKVYLQS